MASFIRDLWTYAGVRKKYWLLPLLILLCVFGGMLILAQTTAIAPFLYTIF